MRAGEWGNSLEIRTVKLILKKDTSSSSISNKSLLTSGITTSGLSVLGNINSHFSALPRSYDKFYEKKIKEQLWVAVCSKIQ